MSYQTRSKLSTPFWLLIGARKTQKIVPRGSSRRSLLFFVPYIFFRPFRLSLAAFICPWVSEDVILSILIWLNHRHPLIIVDSLLCPRGKKALESPYIFSKFTPHNMDTPSIRTLSTALSVCINVLWPSFYCNLIS